MGKQKRGSGLAREGAGIGMAKLLIVPPRGQSPGEGGRGCGRRGTPPPPVVLRNGLSVVGTGYLNAGQDF